MSEGFYRAFEERLRGSRELIKSRFKRVYLPFVEPLVGLHADAQAVDLVCGRGEWLELLKEAGFSAQAVDLDEGMLAACRDLGHKVQTRDAVGFLKELPPMSQVIVSGFHIAEHIPFSDLQTLVQEALRVLKPSGDEPHYVRLYINYLRKKLEKDPANPQYILTERGVGYRFVDFRRKKTDELKD